MSQPAARGGVTVGTVVRFDHGCTLWGMISAGAPWPLSGRDRELRAISAGLRSGGVVVAGAAGVGKTRLAGAAVSGCDDALWVSATESSRGIPLAAFIPVIAHAGGDVDAASLLHRAHLALRERAGSVLVVDDAHLLDDVSATLLHQVAVERRMPLLVTVRTGEPTPDAVTTLWKDGLLTRLDLGPFTEEQTGAVVGAALGGRLDRISTRRLHHVTAGNALWLRHLVDAELADGRFVEVDGVWSWIGEPRLTPALTDLVDAHIGRLTPGVQQVLEILAVGEPLGVSLLTRLTGPAEVDEAVARGLVVTEHNGRRFEARLAHPLYGEAVRARCGGVRIRRLRGLLAETLAATGARRDGDTLRRAVLALGSDLPADPKLLLTGALQANDLTDLALATRLARAARQAGAGFDAQLLLAFVLSWQLRAEEAEREFVSAHELARSPQQCSRVTLARAANLFFMLGRPTEAAAVLAEAETAVPEQVTVLRAARAMIAGASGDLGAAQRAARSVLSADPALPQARTYAWWALAATLALSGRCQECASAAEQAIAAAVQAPETAVFRVNIAFWAALGDALAGNPDGAQRWARGFDPLTRKLEAIFLPVFEGLTALTRGQVRDAATGLAEFRPHLPGSGGGWTGLLEAHLAQALGMCGDAAGAAEAVRRAHAFRHPGMGVVDPQLALAEAWATAASGAVSAAVRQARRAASLARAAGQAAVEVLARHTAVGFGDRAQAPALTELARRVQGPRAPAAAAHARAWAAGDPNALLRVASQLEGAGLLLAAAEAAEQAAVLHRERRDPAAPASAARAAELAAACPGARTPALLATAHPLPITEREREVAVLAARMSNREIAAELGISVRTVEGHIYRACTKLGVSSRTELAKLVGGSRE